MSLQEDTDPKEIFAKQMKRANKTVEYNAGKSLSWYAGYHRIVR